MINSLRISGPENCGLGSTNRPAQNNTSKPLASLGVQTHNMKKYNMKKSITLVFAASTLLLAGCSTTHPSMAWEYRVIRGVAHQPDLEQKLNDAGAQGFVIVSSETLLERPDASPVTIAILKRPKR